MKTLSTIQTLAKIGRIFSKVIFILAIVSGALSLVGLVSLRLGIGDIQIGDVTLESLIENETGRGMGTAYAAAASSLIVCAAEAVLAWFAIHYFAGELADGTPFRMESSRELFRLGILTICIPIGARVLAALVSGLIEAFTEDVVNFDLIGFESVSLGVMFMVLSLFCRCGAETAAPATTGESQEN